MPGLTNNNIAACQIHKRSPEHLFIPEQKLGVVVFKHPRLGFGGIRQSLRNALSSCAGNAFLAVLPETALPFELLPFLREQAAKFNLTVIVGLEHDIKWLDSSAGKGDYERGAFRAENRLAVVRPDPNREVEYAKKNFPAIVNEHSVVEQIERNLHPEFRIVTVTGPDGREINVWPILCSDFLELTSWSFISVEQLDAMVCEQNVDLIAVLSHTRRTDPFHHAIKQLLAGGLHRALPTNFLFANLAFYGGSMCLAYTDKMTLRGSAGDSAFWRERIIPEGEESCRFFPDWPSAVDAARMARLT